MDIGALMPLVEGFIHLLITVFGILLGTWAAIAIIKTLARELIQPLLNVFSDVAESTTASTKTTSKR